MSGSDRELEPIILPAEDITITQSTAMCCLLHLGSEFFLDDAATRYAEQSHRRQPPY